MLLARFRGVTPYGTSDNFVVGATIGVLGKPEWH